MKMKTAKPKKDSKKELLEPKKETLTLDMTEVILQGYQDDSEWAEKFRGAQVLTMSNN